MALTERYILKQRLKRANTSTLARFACCYSTYEKGETRGNPYVVKSTYMRNVEDHGTILQACQRNDGRTGEII